MVLLLGAGVGARLAPLRAQTRECDLECKGGCYSSHATYLTVATLLHSVTTAPAIASGRYC